MTATTFVARTETGTVTRSSATRVYTYAVLVKNSIDRIYVRETGEWDADTRPEGAWGWSGDYANALKMARQAEKVYADVRVVPVLKLQATEPAAMLDSSEKWHAVDLDGNVVAYGRTKADVVERAGITRRAGDVPTCSIHSVKHVAGSCDDLVAARDLRAGDVMRDPNGDLRVVSAETVQRYELAAPVVLVRVVAVDGEFEVAWIFDPEDLCRLV